MSEPSSKYAISRRSGLVVLLFVSTLVVMNVGLIIQNRKLKGAEGDRNRSIVLHEGNHVPALSGNDPNGNKLTFDYGSDPRKSVVLLFSPRCTFCTKNLPNWKAIAQGLDEKSYRIVAVSILSAGVKEYVDKHELTDIPVIADVDPKNKVSYEMTVTPQTIVISADGKVEKVWTGLLQADQLKEIERSLGLKLPAIAENIDSKRVATN